jgi:hypothetical protein
MGGFEVAMLAGFGVVTVGCVTGIVINAMDKLFDGRRRAVQADLDGARQRVGLLEERVTDLQMLNDQLRRNQEWTNRLLEAQEERRELTSGR